jgi:hypothetical protein
MNQYFSRLAERSGVATSAHAAQSSSARASETSGWSEQSSEVIAQPGPFLTDRSAENTNSIGQPASVDKEDFSTDATAEIPETRRSVHALSSAFSEPSTIASNNIASNFQSPLNTAPTMSPSSSLVGQIPMTSDPAGSSADATKNEVGKRTTIAAKPSKQMATENSATAVHRQSNEIPADDTAVSFARTASPFDAATIIKTRTMNPDTSSIKHAESGKAQPSSRENNKVQSTARIASQPAQVLADNEPVARSSSRSSVQINIGRIELEIHAPAKSPVRAPQPTRASSTAAKTPANNSVFNPHRHYLRGR